MSIDPKGVSTKLMLRYIQHWGQSNIERNEARENYLKAAGFKDVGGEAAGLWLADIVDYMPRGKFEDEVAYLEKALQSQRDGK